MMLTIMLYHRYMAISEMEVITSDKWSDDVWGISTASEPLTKLFFYFGRNDHWVADLTRDEIIQVRGGKKMTMNRPEMFVCEEGVPHAFCLSASPFSRDCCAVVANAVAGHNKVMAQKVAGMIEMIQENANA